MTKNKIIIGLGALLGASFFYRYYMKNKEDKK